MQFADIIGQEQVKERLRQLVKQNRLSHALLFLGKEGTGALPLARAFAQYIVCEQVNGKKPAADLFAAPSLFGDEPAVEEPIDMDDSCGVCPACKKAATITHPDIHYTFPVITMQGGKAPPLSSDYFTEWREFMVEQPYANSYDWLQYLKAENKQGNITANECLEIIKKLSLKPYEAEYKIHILWMPEVLGKEGNRLLKLIEEPPPKTLFILVAENESLILPTIVSRTQLVKIPLLSRTDIEQKLKQAYEVNAVQAAQVAILAEGNYREALSLLKNDRQEQEQLLRDWLNSILRGSAAMRQKTIDKIAKDLGRENQKQFLQYFLQMIELAVELQTIGIEHMEGYDLTNGANVGSMIQFADRLSGLCSIYKLNAMAEEISRAIYYIERNANARMLFHALTIKLYHIIRNNSVILIQ